MTPPIHPNDESCRPWGSYTVLLEEPGYKVKQVTVLPEKRLSLQRHRRRSEHWCVVEGEGVVTLNGEEMTLRVGHSVDIPCGAKHRIANVSNKVLKFIEVQRGDYLEEDDIERFDDDYGRVV